LDFAGFSDNEESGSDIDVTFTGGNGGTVILEMVKISGYGPYDHQNQGDLG